MKTRYIALFVALWYFLFFNGCASTPLRIETDGPRLAEILKVDPSEVKYLNYCYFRHYQRLDDGKLAAKYEGWYWLAPSGIVLLTETDLFIHKGDLSAPSSENVTRFPLSDFTGVGIAKQFVLIGPNLYQMHLLKKEELLVLDISHPKKGDQAESELLFDLVLAAGVSKLDSVKYFELKPFIPFMR